MNEIYATLFEIKPDKEIPPRLIDIANRAENRATSINIVDTGVYEFTILVRDIDVVAATIKAAMALTSMLTSVGINFAISQVIGMTTDDMTDKPHAHCSECNQVIDVDKSKCESCGMEDMLK